jgi:threonine synthase
MSTGFVPEVDWEPGSLNSNKIDLLCIGCGRRAVSELPAAVCKHCGDLLEITAPDSVDRNSLFGKTGPGIWRFAASLPSASGEPVTLREGNTPLLKSEVLGKNHGVELYVKNEGQNPTGSFKDRGMTVATTRAKRLGAKFLLCASTGNTSASLAAYSARSGLKAVVVVPSGKIALGKLTQAVAYGSKIIRVEGNFDKALALVLKTVSSNESFYLMNSLNPFRIEGQKTTAYEIYEQLGAVPDYLILPVGNAGNISAIWKGFVELKKWKITDALPVMVGVQAMGAGPIAEAVAKGSTEVEPNPNPETIASAIRIGRPVSWKKALRAIRDSHGTALTVSDAEILAARDKLASTEGIFVELASATPLAALRHLRSFVRKGSRVVCVATGNGLKDQESVKVEQETFALVSDESGLVRAIEEG